ncbi:phosphatidylserine decarboxylase [Acidimangrovimonas pyrenivorans]|uniref:Phosphatidylserine decarboxylase proenzyme n=1 Tax=Acidimangrovimonas pyrenivorans TaxID=2030798 RepID=A0ABV7AF57_9RHOB
MPQAQSKRAAPMKMHETFLKPMHPEGWRFVGIFALATLVLFWIWTPLGLIGTGLTIWCYYFFRNPVRSVPQRDGLIVSPADGIVSMIEPAVPPAELGLEPIALTRVSVFMSVFNVHVNRSPVDGTLAKMAYRPGKFLNASLDKASEDNERNSLLITLPDGRDLVVVQIAGLVARRIVPFVTAGQSLARGERFGLIRFGSRLDVYLPPGVSPLVAEGQTMIAGETVLADLASEEAPRLGRAD